MNTNTQSPLNLESTLDRMKGDRDFLHTLFEVFLEDLPGKLSTLDNALAAQDLATSQRAAHSLKGACATIGAERLQETAYAVEQACTAANLEQAQAQLANLREDAAELQSLLRQELDS